MNHSQVSRHKKYKSFWEQTIAWSKYIECIIWRFSIVETQIQKTVVAESHADCQRTPAVLLHNMGSLTVCVAATCFTGGGDFRIPICYN